MAKKVARSQSKKGTKKKPEKDPTGGLTAAGRKAFKEKDGANLRPGVKGKTDTPEKLKRKGSFLRRHFAHPRGPMEDETGEPTRLAKSAHAWGEAVPKTKAGREKARRERVGAVEEIQGREGPKKRTEAAMKAAKSGKTDAGQEGGEAESRAGLRQAPNCVKSSKRR